MISARSLSLLLAVGVVALMVVPALAAGGAALPGGRAELFGTAPAASAPVVRGASLAHAAVGSSAALRNAGARSAAQPALGSKWTASFFNDVNVTFTVPYVGGETFLTAPYSNFIPAAATGFWMNLTSIKPLVRVNVTIWGWNFPANNTPIPISNYAPATASTNIEYMYVNATKNTTASFYFNDYKFFWPGDKIDFNLTVTALGADPATIYSTSADSYVDPINSTDYATWFAQIGGPWASPDWNQSILVSSTPDIFSTPAYDPNPHQPLQFTLQAIAPEGVAQGTIPDGIMYYSYLENGSLSSSATALTPANGTIVQLESPLGPFPNSTVSVQFELWLPWFGGSIDHLWSPVFNFNWSKNGGWYYPDQGLLANLELSTNPLVLPPSNGVVQPGEPVAVTLHEPIENVTISSASVNYIFRDGLGSHSGVLPMTLEGLNTTTVTIPGLPPGSSVEFSLSAKDTFGNPVFSQNYTYSSASPVGIYPAERGFFFFEALDVTGTGFVPSLNYSISNGSWSEHGVTNSLGFGAPVVPHGLGYLLLGYGAYDLSITVFGETHSTIVTVENQTPFTIVFYVASGQVPFTSTSSLPVLTAASVLGLVAAFGALGVVWPWYKDRRKRIEAEQRRITL